MFKKKKWEKIWGKKKRDREGWGKQMEIIEGETQINFAMTE